MYLILHVVLIVIMSYFIMYFVSDDKNKGDQSKINRKFCCKISFVRHVL